MGISVGILQGSKTSLRRKQNKLFKNNGIFYLYNERHTNVYLYRLVKLGKLTGEPQTNVFTRSERVIVLLNNACISVKTSSNQKIWKVK